MKENRDKTGFLFLPIYYFFVLLGFHFIKHKNIYKGGKIYERRAI